MLTPNAAYAAEDRDLLCRQISYVDALLTRNGVPVMFDAAANRRCHRECARKEIPQLWKSMLSVLWKYASPEIRRDCIAKCEKERKLLSPGVQTPY